MTTETNIKDFAAKVAAHLAGDWRTDPVSRAEAEDKPYLLTHPRIRRADGLSFSLKIEPWPKAAEGRIGISCDWPKNGKGESMTPRFSEHSEHGKTEPGITVAADKTAEQVAKEITRRFLSVYEPIWQRMKERADSIDSHRAKRLELARTVAAIVDGTVKEDRCGEAVVTLPQDRRLYSVELGGRIVVTLSVTLDELRTLAQTFAGPRPREAR